MTARTDFQPRELNEDDWYDEPEPEVLAAIDERRQARWDAMTPEEQAQAAAAFEQVPF
jgi:hypothetical protein